MFSINISMVTNIYSGTASGQALFNDESCVSQTRLGTVVHELIPTVERWPFRWRLALGCAARKGFLQMLIHRWYRMLRPSAWLSWDTKLAQVSQRGLVFLKSTSAWDNVDFILVSVILKAPPSYEPLATFMRRSEKFIEQHGRTRCDAFGKRGVVDAKSLWWETKQRDGGEQQNSWLIIGCYLSLGCDVTALSAVISWPFVSWLWCPDFLLLYFNAFFTEQHCIVAAVKLDCCSLRIHSVKEPAPRWQTFLL